MRISHTIEIEAPIESVWNLTVDIESWPDHTPTMTQVRRLDTGQLGVGSQARIKQPGQGESLWTVTKLGAPEDFEWSTKLIGMTMTARHRLRAEGSTTLNTLIVDVDGPLSILLGWLLKRPILKAITAENEGLKVKSEGRG